MPNSETLPITRFAKDGPITVKDVVTLEEPLEIRLAYGAPEQRTQQSISITMRTPDNDVELALGFLLTEGIIQSADHVADAGHCGPPVMPLGLRNVVKVELKDDVFVDLDRLKRHFYTSSSCGVCGKTSLEALRTQMPTVPSHSQFSVSADDILSLPDQLMASQNVFAQTGGLHAAGMFDAFGKIQCVREDVGRHNAVDKLIGTQVIAKSLPLENFGIVVSGRASFELMQKTVMCGAAMLVAVSAPSSLAIALANEFNVTLIGFLRNQQFNVYTGVERVYETKNSD